MLFPFAGILITRYVHRLCHVIPLNMVGRAGTMSPILLIRKLETKVFTEQPEAQPAIEWLNWELKHNPGSKSGQVSF